MNRFIDFVLGLQFIFRPRYWFLNHQYSREWDKELNRLLKEYHFTDISYCTSMLGDTCIWTTNFPYASFTQYNNNSINVFNHRFRPSRVTLLRAKKKLNESMMIEFGRIKSNEELYREAINNIRNVVLVEPNEVLWNDNLDLKQLIKLYRLHPTNMVTYNNKKSLQHNTKIRKHTFKYG